MCLSTRFPLVTSGWQHQSDFSPCATVNLIRRRNISPECWFLLCAAQTFIPSAPSFYWLHPLYQTVKAPKLKPCSRFVGLILPKSFPQNSAVLRPNRDPITAGARLDTRQTFCPRRRRRRKKFSLQKCNYFKSEICWEKTKSCRAFPRAGSSRQKGTRRQKDAGELWLGPVQAREIIIQGH